MIINNVKRLSMYIICYKQLHNITNGEKVNMLPQYKTRKMVPITGRASSLLEIILYVR